MDVSISEAVPVAAKEKEGIQLVVFTLAGCELAIGIRQVREIIRVSDLTLMPKAPKFLEGIINLRGRIIPVLDLKKRFDMPQVEKTIETRILVTEIKDQMLGLLVDKVAEVLRADLAAVEPVKDAVLTIGPEFIRGSLTLENRLVLLFNLEKLFSADELRSLPDVETTSP